MSESVSRYKNRLRSPRLWSLAAAAAASVLYMTGVLDPLERALADIRFELTGRAASGDLVLVGIDPRSLEQLDVWPWPRSYHAAVVDRLVEAGAVQIALDVDFSSHSGPAEDEALAAALSRAPGQIVLPVFRQKTPLGDGRPEIIYTAPLPLFRRHARVASVNTMPDGDGLIRRHSLNDFWRDEVVATMPALLAGWSRAPSRTFHIDYGIRPDTIPVLSYVDVMQGRFDPEEVRGRVPGSRGRTRSTARPDVFSTALRQASARASRSAPSAPRASSTNR